MIKLILGFLGPYKYAIIAVALVGVLSTVYMHIRNDGIRDTQLAVYEQSNAAQARRITRMNGRFTRQNEAKLAEIAKAEEKMKAAQAAARDVEAKNTEMEIDIGVLRFENLEAMQNDEEYADWAYGTVHPTAWLMLGKAATTVHD